MINEWVLQKGVGLLSMLLSLHCEVVIFLEFCMHIWKNIMDMRTFEYNMQKDFLANEN